jgi:transcriptional regulator with XRE-family HTH domain
MVDGQNAINTIPDGDLREDYYDNLHTAYNNMIFAFSRRSDQGITQDDLASRLNVDKSLISRRLNGRENLTLRSLSYMASAMECRLIIQFQPFEEIPKSNQFSSYFPGWPDQQTRSASNSILADSILAAPQIDWLSDG